MSVFTASLPSPEVAADRKDSHRWRFVRIPLAVILLTAARLKAYQLATVPSLGNGLLDTRWLNILVVEFELFFGIWLLFGMLPKWTWFASLACFTVFATVSFCKVAIGADSCGCFGTVRVNPWITFTMNVCIVVVLFTCRPAGISLRIRAFLDELIAEHRWRRVTIMIASWVLLAVPMMAAVTSVSENSMAELGTEFIGANGQKTILLEPEHWIGKEFPLLNYITPVKVIDHQVWLVLFFTNECSVCRESLARMEDLSAEFSNDRTFPNLAAIEVPSQKPFLSPSRGNIRYGQMNLRSSWKIHPPFILLIDDYEVKAVFSKSKGMELIYKIWGGNILEK